VAAVSSFFAGALLSSLATAVIVAVVGYLSAQGDGGFTRSARSGGVASFIILALLGLMSVFYSSSFEPDKLRRSVFAATGTFLLGAVGGMAFTIDIFQRVISDQGGWSVLVLIVALGAAIYTLISIFLYARRETISLAIGSKGGSNTPIAISGITGFGIFNTAAIKALSAEPAEHAEEMLKELGALITDVQTMGDFGVQKWTRQRPA
jgi:hypothetical protein